MFVLDVANALWSKSKNKFRTLYHVLMTYFVCVKIALRFPISRKLHYYSDVSDFTTVAIVTCISAIPPPPITSPSNGNKVGIELCVKDNDSNSW